MKQSEILDLIKRHQPIFAVVNDQDIRKDIFTTENLYYLDDGKTLRCIDKGTLRVSNFEFNKLFDNEEDAKEYAKFGFIYRTEKFPYMPYEEAVNYKGNLEDVLQFRGPQDDYFIRHLTGIFRLYSYTYRGTNSIYEVPDTREGYKEILEVAVKKFYGDED